MFITWVGVQVTDGMVYWKSISEATRLQMA
jgi:hypothetical protein